MKISEVLRKAKPHLRRKRFVCLAIHAVEVDYFYRRKAKRYIAKLIKPHNAVNFWLISRGISEEDLTLENNLLYRERWIDHMISELEKEGK